jgi:hypothetical protein
MIMKRVIFLVMIFVSLAGCKKEDNKGQLDPNAMVKIRPAVTRAEGHLSALEIVQETGNLKFYNRAIYGDQPVGIGFADSQRDLVTPCLKMWGTDIIYQDGSYVPDFIEAEDCVLQRVHNQGQAGQEWIDTIAYIPNAILRSSQVRIKAAYDVGNYTEVYRLFDSTYIFIPITGQEWRALKALGLQ